MELDYQLIVDKLQTLLPLNWKNTVFMAEYTSGSYSMRCFADMGDGKYQDCLLLDGISKAQAIKIFREIDKEIQKCRKSLANDKMWYTVTMKFDCDGHFKAEFDYDKHEENALGYIKDWKQKYLYANNIFSQNSK